MVISGISGIWESVWCLVIFFPQEVSICSCNPKINDVGARTKMAAFGFSVGVGGGSV